MKVFAGETLGFSEMSHGAIRRWRLLVVAAAGLLLLALLAWRDIPRLEDPNVEPTDLYASFVYPGASPEDVESQVVRQVEDGLYSMDGVLWVESSSIPNAAVFRIKFREGTAMEVAAERVRGQLASKKKDLPPEVRDPDVTQLTIARAVPQMVLAVVGNRSDRVLTNAAERLKAELLGIDGVASVDLRGEHKPAVLVRLDPVKLAQHRITADKVVQQLRRSNVRLPGGEVEVGPWLTLLRVAQGFRDAASVLKVPIASTPDETGAARVLSLGDVADVRDDALTPPQRFLVGSEPAVGLEVHLRVNENAVAIGERIKARLAELRAPEGTRFAIVHDQPAWISDSIGGLLQNLLEGILLVMVVITVGMGWRAALVVSAVLPLATAGGIYGLYLLGFALDQVSIAGLIIALGLLVDDAVVVTESIEVMRAKGLSAVRAAVYGTARVFWANNATTAVACAMFIPLFVMQGTTGRFVRGIPAAVVVCLVTSLFVAQLLTPWLATLILRPKKGVVPIPDHVPFDRNRDSGDGRDAAKIYDVIARLVVRFPGWVIVAFTAMLGLSFALFPRIGLQFFPRAEKPLLFVKVSMPRGSDPEMTNETLAKALAIVSGDEAIASTSAVSGAGYPTIYFGRATQGPRKDFADIMLRLKDGADTQRTARRLRRRLADVVGASCTVDELYYGPPVPHPVLVRVYGDDYERLRAYAAEIKSEILAQPGTINIVDNLTDTIPTTDVTLDPDRALRVGLTAAQVGTTLRWLHGEDKVTEFREREDLVPVIVQEPLSSETSLEAVAQTPIPNAAGATVPLREAGNVALGHTLAELKRRNGRRIVEISADVDDKTLPSTVTKKLDRWLRAKKWDPGYGFSYGGSKEEIEKSFRSLGIAALFGMIIIFVLLVLILRSLRLSTIVLVAVPFALIGSLSGLALTGHPFGFMSFLGLIALVGVYVNHKIYFLDRVQELLGRGADLTTAIRMAGQDRIRPVVLTALTAVLGLLPLTLEGGRLWAPFGWVNIFGLLASIPLSLVLLPAFVVIVHRRRG